MYKSSFRSNGRAVLMCTTEGLVKLIADDNDRLIACHVLGNHAADIVQEATALIQMGATVETCAPSSTSIPPSTKSCATQWNEERQSLGPTP